MRRFKSAAHAQRFASVHGVVQNLFRVGRSARAGAVADYGAVRTLPGRTALVVWPVR